MASLVNRIGPYMEAIAGRVIKILESFKISDLLDVRSDHILATLSILFVTRCWYIRLNFPTNVFYMLSKAIDIIYPITGICEIKT